jgi:hypothetical protein
MYKTTERILNKFWNGAWLNFKSYSENLILVRVSPTYPLLYVRVKSDCIFILNNLH